jgi:hypothetical protein
MNHGNRRTPGDAAALIGRRRAGVIVTAAFDKVAGGRGMRMSAIRLLMVVTVRRSRMIMALRSRARMARPAACGKGQRNGEGKDDRQTAFHAGETIRASCTRCNDGGNAANGPRRNIVTHGANAIVSIARPSRWYTRFENLEDSPCVLCSRSRQSLSSSA